MATDIVLDDAQATPVTHTFKPVGRDAAGIFWFEDQSQPHPIGWWKISVELKKPPVATAGTSSSGRTFRVVVGLHEPVLETLSNSSASGILPAPTVSYIPRSFTEYVMPERSTSIDRQSLRKMSANLQDNAQIIAVVTDLVALSS